MSSRKRMFPGCLLVDVLPHKTSSSVGRLLEFWLEGCINIPGSNDCLISMASTSRQGGETSPSIRNCKMGSNQQLFSKDWHARWEIDWCDATCKEFPRSCVNVSYCRKIVLYKRHRHFVSWVAYEHIAVSTVWCNYITSCTYVVGRCLVRKRIIKTKPISQKWITFAGCRLCGDETCFLITSGKESFCTMRLSLPVQ